MSDEIGVGNARPQPSRYEQATPLRTNQVDEAFVQAQPQDAPFDPNPPRFQKPANPYAPTGWRKKQRVEFDLELPSGQLCRIMRLERDDLLRMNLLEHLDTFTPILMDNMSDEERQEKMEASLRDDPKGLNTMLSAIDKVVLACTVKPKITEDVKLVNYGTEDDWGNPNFTATVHLDDIDTFERMYIFGAAFGRSMEDLKSLFEQAQGVGPMDTMQDVRLPAQ